MVLDERAVEVGTSVLRELAGMEGKLTGILRTDSGFRVREIRAGAGTARGEKGERGLEIARTLEQKWKGEDEIATRELLPPCVSWRRGEILSRRPTKPDFKPEKFVCMCVHDPCDGSQGKRGRIRLLFFQFMQCERILHVFFFHTSQICFPIPKFVKNSSIEEFFSSMEEFYTNFASFLPNCTLGGLGWGR